MLLAMIAAARPVCSTEHQCDAQDAAGTIGQGELFLGILARIGLEGGSHAKKQCNDQGLDDADVGSFC